MIEIIEGGPEDAAAIVEFTKKVGGETDNLTFGAEGLEVTPEQEAMFLKEMRENPRAVFLCAWKEDNLIGTGFLGGMSKRMKHRATLAISILKSEWGKGVGSAMLEKLIEFAESIGIEIINLEVRCDNSRAIQLYEKYGFRCLGTSPAFFKIGDKYIDFELMYLDLRQLQIQYNQGAVRLAYPFSFSEKTDSIPPTELNKELYDLKAVGG